MKKVILLTLMLIVFGVQPAFAYIDPGSGSVIMSVIIGFFVATGVLVKTFWYKIKSFLGFPKSKSTETKDNNISSNHDDNGK